MKSKPSAALAAASCVLAMTVGAAKADLFDISGTFASGALGTLSGTLTVDVTAGSVTAIDAIYSTSVVGPLHFTNLISSHPAVNALIIEARDAPMDLLEFAFFNTTGTLVGFNLHATWASHAKLACANRRRHAPDCGTDPRKNIGGINVDGGAGRGKKEF